LIALKSEIIAFSWLRLSGENGDGYGTSCGNTYLGDVVAFGVMRPSIKRGPYVRKRRWRAVIAQERRC
jgi:hypothetical protein